LKNAQIPGSTDIRWCRLTAGGRPERLHDTVPEGQTSGLVGLSGAGKTTLFLLGWRLVARLVPGLLAGVRPRLRSR